MIAKLTLATGRHAGVAESLKHGYYMIGRDDECQIRPRSQSVSRRHCLLHHSRHGLRVFDLASANGTHVNDQRLEPSQWAWLNSGDKLRCGKLIFAVFVQSSREDVGPPVAAVSQQAKVDSCPRLVKDRAWDDFDIASFLEAEDEAERKRRYASLQTRARADESQPDSQHDAPVDNPSRLCEVTSIDLVKGDQQARAVLDEARRKAAYNGGSQTDDSDSRSSPRAIRIAALRAKIDAQRVDAERNEAIKRTLSGTGRVTKRPAAGRSSTGKSGAPRSMAAIKQPGYMKLYAVILFAMLTGCFCICSVYRAAVVAPAHVIQEID